MVIDCGEHKHIWRDVGELSTVVDVIDFAGVNQRRYVEHLWQCEVCGRVCISATHPFTGELDD